MEDKPLHAGDIRALDDGQSPAEREALLERLSVSLSQEDLLRLVKFKVEERQLFAWYDFLVAEREHLEEFDVDSVYRLEDVHTQESLDQFPDWLLDHSVFDCPVCDEVTPFEPYWVTAIHDEPRAGDLTMVITDLGYGYVECERCCTRFAYEKPDPFHT